MLSVLIGIILSSAFPAILVYAQELVPGKVGLIPGLFFDFAFGIAGIGSAVFGQLADRTSIEYVYWVCSFSAERGIALAWSNRSKLQLVLAPTCGRQLTR